LEGVRRVLSRLYPEVRGGYFFGGTVPSGYKSVGVHALVCRPARTAAPFASCRGCIRTKLLSIYRIKEGFKMTTVAKVIELVGESKVSWDDAVRSAVREASKTVDNLTGVEVVNFTANLDNEEIIEYKVNLKLAFGVRERR